jgi:CheY-like chemotaxis protein
VRVVVVDDQPRARFVVRAVLEDLGYAIAAEAPDGAQGVAAVAAHEPALVIMDWQMPVMDGVTATSEIKASWPAVQVVAYSSSSDAETRERFLAAGASEYVAKGDLDGLLAAVQRCAVAVRPA